MLNSFMFCLYENRKVHAVFVFYRFIDTIIAQRESRKSPKNENLKCKAKDMEQRLALQNLFERFMESAPQLILQLYILFVAGIDAGTFKGEIY